jgi:transcriptional regulator with PAS, ATPase and Fis domain
MDQSPSLDIATEALLNTPIGILILDQKGRIAWLNPALEKLLDITADRLIGQSAATAEPAWRSLLFAPEQSLFLEGTAARPARWLQTWRMTPQKTGGALHYYAEITDLQNALEELARLNEELAQQNTRDAVTGLPNRQALLQGLEPLVSRSRRYQNPLSVIRLRIDNLADIDAGHGKGNADRA